MTDNELRRMQEEAVRRTQEMHRRAEAARTNTRQGADNPRSGSQPVNTQPAETARMNMQSQPVQPAQPVQPIHSRESSNAPVNELREHEINSHEHHRPVFTEASDDTHSGGVFDALFRDKEKTLILGLMLLLMDEKTDNSLLMALMYLLI